MGPRFRKTPRCRTCDKPLTFRPWRMRNGRQEWAREHGKRAWCWCDNGCTDR